MINFFLCLQSAYGRQFISVKGEFPLKVFRIFRRAGICELRGDEENIEVQENVGAARGRHPG